MRQRRPAELAALALLVLLAAGCATQVAPSTSYYVLEYYPELESNRLIRDEPFPYTVHVLDARIPRTYNRRQIVVRDAGPRFSYSATDVWGVDLADIIPDLVATRLQRYRMFRSVRREYLGEASDIDVETNIRALEFVRTGSRGQARLEMEFSLVVRGSAASPVQHRVARQDALADATVETFVIRINDMILEEIDAFVSKLVRYLESGETGEAFPAPQDQGRLEPFAEDVQGFGVVLMPSLSGTDQEPFYRVYGADGTEVSSAKMGVPVVVPEGRYRITYGSGRESQLMEMQDVVVVPRYKRIIEPDWGALTVSIVTESREWVRTSYELFDGQSGESYGTDISADETRGEQGRVWVLRPGTYKITINGEPFTTYRDFTTATVVAGETRHITIVVDTDQQGNPTSLLGAGVLEEESEGATDRPVRLNATVSGTVDFSSDNQQIPDDYAVTTTVAGEFGARLVVDQEPLLYTLRTVVEAGFQKSPDTDYRISSDDVILKNTLIYFFFRNLGLYGRFDLDTHLFPQQTYPGSTPVEKQDSEGVALPGWPRTVEDWQIAPSFFPLILRQGLGLNHRLVNLSRADLNLRTGLGLKQEFNEGVYAYEEGTSAPQVWREQETTYKTGIEVSAVGSVSLPNGLTCTSSADLLFPFEQGSPVSLEWENILDVRLLRYLSLEYTFLLKNRYEESSPYSFWDGRSFILDHKLVLRATYVIR